MGVNIEKMRADMRVERVKIRVQVVGLAVAAFAAGAVWMHFLRG